MLSAQVENGRIEICSDCRWKMTCSNDMVGSLARNHEVGSGDLIVTDMIHGISWPRFSD